VSLRYLEDYEVGLVIRSGRRLVTKEEIVDFAKSWDPQPFHIDEDAARASIHGGIIACTAHIFAIICRLGAEMETKDAGLAALGFDEMRIHQPLRAGDTVYFTAECTEVNRSRTKPDRGVVKTQSELFNQRNELVFSMCCTFMLASREAEGLAANAIGARL
jgi:acyl dehydratase